MFSFASETDLTDAISRHGYAFYSDISGKTLTCDLSPPGKARVICASREEHQELFRFLEALVIYHLPGFDRKPIKALRFLDVESVTQAP